MSKRAKRCVWKDNDTDPCNNGRRCLYGDRHMTQRQTERLRRKHERYHAGLHDWAMRATELPF